MNKKIEKNIKELTGANKIVSLEELCNYINNECYKEFKREYNFNCNNIIEENWQEDLQGTLQVGDKSYNIYNCHIEVYEVGKVPLIIYFTYVDVTDENENKLEDYLFI